MSIGGVSGLIKDIEVSFGVPLILFAFIWVNVQFSKSTWFRYTRRWFSQQTIRIGIAVCLLGFAFLFGVVVIYQDWPILASLWQSSPIQFSLLYTAVAILIAAAISTIAWWKLRPSLWNVRNPEPNA